MKKTLLILSFFIFNYTFSQKNIDSLYVKYFEAKREIPYLHLNKTTFLTGEEVWFKAYVINNKKKKTSKFTRNLHCYLYNENKKIIKKKMLFVENGVANGNFKIDSTLTNSSYYIAASTNWMQNFSEDETFFQKLTILNKNKSKITISNNLDIQVLPEGGHHIKSSINNFGLIIKDKNNIGFKTDSIFLIDNENNLLKKISTNKFGLAKFNFFYSPNKEYFLEIDLGNNNIIKKKIPKANEIGLTLSIENLIPNYFKVNIKTNKKTLRNIKNKVYKLFIHNTNYFMNKNIIFDDENTEVSILVPKKKIDVGISIITLFDNKNYPIAERLTYIHDKNLKQQINIEKQKITNDSLEIKISKKGLDSIKYVMSASILPINTKSYNPRNSIISKFILMPFIKGHIQNPSYYFNQTNRRKLLDLELLLLTQGWSKYDWKNIFYETPILNAISENGITLKGTLNVKKIDKKSKILLASPHNHLFLTKKLKNNKFEFSRLYLKDSSEVNFVISTKNKNKKTTGYFHQIKYNLNYKVNKYNSKYEFKDIYEVSNFIEKDRISLNAIELKLKKKPKHKPFIFGFSEVFIPEGSFNETQKLSSFLNQNGFFIKNRNDDSFDFFISKRNTIISVFWDEFQYDEDISTVINMNINEFSEIHYSDREIHLYTNDNFRKSNLKKVFNKIKIKNGYTEPIEYYRPKYKGTNTGVFEKYGAIFWEPNININKQNTSFKVPLLNQKSFTIFIEGLTSSGKYIYEKKIIHIDSDD